MWRPSTCSQNTDATSPRATASADRSQPKSSHSANRVRWNRWRVRRSSGQSSIVHPMPPEQGIRPKFPHHWPRTKKCVLVDEGGRHEHRARPSGSRVENLGRWTRDSGNPDTVLRGPQLEDGVSSALLSLERDMSVPMAEHRLRVTDSSSASGGSSRSGDAQRGESPISRSIGSLHSDSGEIGLFTPPLQVSDVIQGDYRST